MISTKIAIVDIVIIIGSTKSVDHLCMPVAKSHNADSPTIIIVAKNIDFKILVGTIASGDIFCTDIKMKEKIRNKFEADAIEMEGAAIAQVCKLDDIPFIVIRGISDSPNGNNEITFEQYLEKASKRCAQIIEKFFEN